MAEANSFTDCSGQTFSPNAIVSKGGQGTFTTLTDAVKAIPSSARGRYIIYVKNGVYEENVTICRREVTLIGDGKGKTIIRSRLSCKGGGINIQHSGAVIVLADDFIAKCITFENASGKDKGPAVALRSQGDKSAFYLCEFLGYQDTLYVNGGRQFFRECDVYGTVDFIFGDAAMVLQKCNIYFRDSGVMTAQGRMDKSRNTAISIDNCSIRAGSEFPAGAQKCFLGRPWKDYARAIVMKSYIGDVINLAGYLEWEGRSKSAEYVEYANSGPGSVCCERRAAESIEDDNSCPESKCCCPGSKSCPRVGWPGFRVLALDEGEHAKPYSVGVFIDGNQWLPSTGVPFDPVV